jgi:hypothetical protein
MGKKWDYDVPTVELWAECLRVLKPGGHLLAFAGTRTQHRMAVRIEDAGFEIRDMIAWVYGSGFPKSHDVSKAIDKRRTEDLQPAAHVARWLVQQMEARGISRRDICDHFKAENIAQGWTTYWTDGAAKPRVPKWGQWLELRRWLDLPDDMDGEVWRLNGRKGKPSDNFAERETIETRVGVDTSKQKIAVSTTAQGLEKSTKREFAITAPATEAARQWHGWGSALKPALEPITVARKPLIGTIAENVLQHGTGAINVDGCRIGRTNNDVSGWSQSGSKASRSRSMNGANYARAAKPDASSRWPANLIHDGSLDVVKELKSAARFFYTAKAGGRDRNANLDPDNPNAHPTVKPLLLMQYLVRLVTVEGGIVLDPFMGSGTTGLACRREGREFIGMEREAAYFQIAKNRIENDTDWP